jgi:hypothetical protein
VPESPLVKEKEEPMEKKDTVVAVDIAKSVRSVSTTLRQQGFAFSE